MPLDFEHAIDLAFQAALKVVESKIDMAVARALYERAADDLEYARSRTYPKAYLMQAAANVAKLENGYLAAVVYADVMSVQVEVWKSSHFHDAAGKDYQYFIEYHPFQFHYEVIRWHEDSLTSCGTHSTLQAAQAQAESLVADAKHLEETDAGYMGHLLVV